MDGGTFIALTFLVGCALTLLSLWFQRVFYATEEEKEDILNQIWEEAEAEVAAEDATWGVET